MTAYYQSFKPWVPRWLMIATIAITIIPIGCTLGIYLGGINSAMSYYQADASDIRFSVVICYLAIAASGCLEKRFFSRFASKPYFIGVCIIYLSINLALYLTRNLAILLVLRFIVGMTLPALIGILFTFIFQQFHSQRSRVLGYATFYGALLGAAPLSYLIDAFVFSYHDFNTVFMLQMMSCVPGFVLMFICLKDDVDLRKKKQSLKDVDWASFVLYASALILVAYVLLYGQYYGWLESDRIIGCIIALICLFTLFFIRQVKQPTPYIDVKIYKYRNFRIGMGLLIAFYLSKGGTSAGYGFLGNCVNLDVFHQSYVMMVNTVGLIIGAGLTARFILAKRRIRLIWLTGFGCLLVYNVWLMLIIGRQAETTQVMGPYFFQGLGTGILILSVVLFYVTSVPEEIGFSASTTGVSYRFFTFTLSMALVSFLGLRQNSIHYHDFADEVVSTNIESQHRMQLYEQGLLNRGATPYQAAAGAQVLLGASVKKQTDLLFARDYYLYMSVFTVIVMMGIALIPRFQYYIRKINKKLVPI